MLDMNFETVLEGRGRARKQPPGHSPNGVPRKQPPGRDPDVTPEVLPR